MPNQELLDLYLPTSSSRLLAFDYEATGLTSSDSIVGVSFVDTLHLGGVYFSFKNCSEEIKHETLRRIACRPSIVHNAQYEQFMTFNTIKQYANINYDTQCLLNQIEGDWASVKGNKGLKNLQVSLLGWEYKGDIELDEWLRSNGYIDSRGRVIKGAMHNAPDSILGKYCNLDAQSTWDLYQWIFYPVLERFPELDFYHKRDFMNLIKLIDTARRDGLTIDLANLAKHKENLQKEMDQLLDKFYNDSPATSLIKEYNESVVVQHYNKMPAKTTKAGTPSKNYEKWKTKLEDLKNTQHFNANSKQQLAMLFYDRLYQTRFNYRQKENMSGPVYIFKKGVKYKVMQCSIDVEGVGSFEWEVNSKADSNKPLQRKCDKEILPFLGEAGKLLASYNKLNKEMGYVVTMQETSKDGKHYPQLKVSGTKTDRCSGTGGLNIQQLPKSRGYLECLIPKKGTGFIQMDVNALEPVVLAELSSCPSYMSLYGPGRPPNDVYLFIASKIPQFAQEVLSAGYDPDNPTKEGIAAAKKLCKRIRTICKIIHLAAGYGAGTTKIYKTMVKQGISITYAEVNTIRTMYWEVFAAVVNYRERLTAEWRANKGFFLDGFGMPITVEAEFEKDILNRAIQKTGHAALVRYLYNLVQLKPTAMPKVPDYHDETIWESPLDCIQEDLKKFETAWNLTNKELGGIIPLYGKPEIHTSFAGFKCSD